MRLVLATAILAIAMPALAADAPATGQVDPTKDKLVCKREVPIGSLIATRKRCMTKAQWAQVIQDGNDAARKMIEDNQGRPTTN